MYRNKTTIYVIRFYNEGAGSANNVGPSSSKNCLSYAINYWVITVSKTRFRKSGIRENILGQIRKMQQQKRYTFFV